MTQQELHERIAGLHCTMLMMRLGVGQRPDETISRASAPTVPA